MKDEQFPRPTTPATDQLIPFLSCDERRLRQILGRLVQQIENPYRNKSE
jgi:hypothetical protein